MTAPTARAEAKRGRAMAKSPAAPAADDHKARFEGLMGAIAAASRRIRLMSVIGFGLIAAAIAGGELFRLWAERRTPEELEALGRALERIVAGLGEETATALAGAASAFLAVALVLVSLFALIARRRAAARLSALIGEIYGGARKGGWRPPLVLHLRSFHDDATLIVSPRFPLGRFLGLRFELLPTSTELMARLQSAAAPMRAAIRIGDKRFLTAAGAPITVDDADWWKTFRGLAGDAETIVMAPMSKPGSGTFRELTAIFAEPALLRKTVFLAPADRPPPKWLPVRLLRRLAALLTPGKSHRWIAGRARWTETREALLAEPSARKAAQRHFPAYPGAAGVVVPARGGAVFLRGVSGRSWDHPLSLRSYCRGAPFGRSAVREALGATFHVGVVYALVALFVFASLQDLAPALRRAVSGGPVAEKAAAQALLLAAVAVIAARRYARYCNRHGLRAWARGAFALAPLAALGVAILAAAPLRDIAADMTSGPLAGVIAQTSTAWLAAYFAVALLVMTLGRPQRL